MLTPEQIERTKKTIKVLKALCHPLHGQMLDYLKSNPNAAVTSIYQKLGLDQSDCSQHLGQLRRAGMVTTQRTGKNILYSINQTEIDGILEGVSVILSV